MSYHPSTLLNVATLRFGAAQPALFAIPVERPVFLREYSTNHYSVSAYFASRFTVEAIVTFLQTVVSILCSYFLIGFQANLPIFICINYAVAMSSTALAVLLGCSIDDGKLAQEFLPLLFVPQMLFAGFFVAVSLLPIWLRWVPYICSLAYGVKLGLLAEFEGCATSEGAESTFCKEVLSQGDAEIGLKTEYWVILIAIFVVTRLLALYVLKLKASQFY